MRIALAVSLILIGIGDVCASHQPPGLLELLVDGIPAPKYLHQGMTYLEAIKGKEYEIRITNPTDARVAVALSVDGLNTIDARHTEANSARKWVLGPYESVVISGWQTSDRQARRFFFTTEDRSYGAWTGQTENLGVISAAFFRERSVCRPISERPRVMPAAPGSSPADQKGQASADAAGASRQARSAGEVRAESPAPEADYAATGIGDRIRHEVQLVSMELEDKPFSTVNLRYEFHPVLVRLGVLPPSVGYNPLGRREKAKGFRQANYCPEP
jgi:hypothetical protein